MQTFPAGLLRTFVAAAIILSSGIQAVTFADVFPNPSIAQNSDSGSNRYNGLKKSLYYVVHDIDSPISNWSSRVASIESKELGTRDFFAENSGGKFDIYYEDIIDVAIELNSDGTRPSNWVTLANNVATGTYGKNLNDYYMYAYDVDDTQASSGQGWGGLSTGDRIYLQSTSERIINHEIGHRISLGHARAITPRNNSSSYHTYTWDENTETYQSYTPGSAPFNSTPYGSALYQYGNYFDTMGSGVGDFSVPKKRDLGWLTTSQVPVISTSSITAETTFKIYAHDELQSTTDGSGDYGVLEGYDSSVLYGLAFDRGGEVFNTSSNQFDNTPQRVFLEYRSGENGLLFYLDTGNISDSDNAMLLDLDPTSPQSSSSKNRLLKVGTSIEDIDFGLSNFFVDTGSVNQGTPDTDFLLDFTPSAPSEPTSLRPEWFHFNVLGSGSDATGSFMEVAITVINPLNGLDGDLDQNGFVTQTDFDLFIAGWLTDTGTLSSVEKYLYGDMNLDGITDLNDAWLFREAWAANGNGSADFSNLPIPEPSAIAILFAAMLFGGPMVLRKRK